MNDLLLYFLKMTLWLTGFGIVYHLVLKKERFFNLNRWFLLSGIICSVFMPFYSVKYQVVKSLVDMPVVADNPVAISSLVEEHSEYSTINWILILYFAGIAFIFGLALYRYFLLVKMLRQGEKVKVKDRTIVKVKKEIAPFSFFNKIIISRSLFAKEVDVHSVVAHEKVHIEEKHWIDLMLVSLIRTLQWFNPIIIFYRKAIVQNHEYLADAGSITRGVNPQAYKALLANQMLGMQVISVASSFTSLQTFKRIEMMSKYKSSPIRKLRILWVFPIIACILFAFAEPEYVTPDNATSSVVSLKGITVKGQVKDNNGVVMPGVSVLVKNTTTGAISDRNGEFVIESVDPNAMIVFSFVGFETVQLHAKNNLLVTLSPTVCSHPLDIAPPPPPPPAPVENLPNGERPVFYVVESLPKFMQGNEVLQNHIINCFGKEILSEKKSIIMTVKVDGSIKDVAFEPKGNSNYSDNQIKKFIDEMPKWEPGKQRGKPVSVRVSIDL